VSTDAGGVPAIMTDGEHGFLVPRGDHRALADRVLRLLGDPGLAARVTTSARAACEAYRWSAVRDRWLAIYRQLASRHLIHAGWQANPHMGSSATHPRGSTRLSEQARRNL
jgi:glycosyltransferase involved in cell wall biosynthesis